MGDSRLAVAGNPVVVGSLAAGVDTRVVGRPHVAGHQVVGMRLPAVDRHRAVADSRVALVAVVHIRSWADMLVAAVGSRAELLVGRRPVAVGRLLLVVGSRHRGNQMWVDTRRLLAVH